MPAPAPADSHKDFRVTGFPIRATFVGACMALLISTVFPYGILVKGTAIGPTDFITSGALFLLFVLVLINTATKWLLPRWSFSSGELVVVYTMMVVASAIPIIGVTAQLIPFLTGVFYYATPENNWDQLIHPYVKTWLVPGSDNAIRYFFEGLPQGADIPWGPWVRPLLMWGSFMMALYLMMIAIATILHKRWQDHERLVYPLVQLPLDMLTEKRGSVFNNFLRSPLMWLGFAIPFVLLSFKGLHAHFPSVPDINLTSSLTLFSGMQGLGYAQDELFIAVRFLLIGLTYFLPLEVSFSLWFFYLVNHLMVGIFTSLGFDVAGMQEMHSEGSIASAHLGMGAMIVLVVVILWTARSHLKGAFKSAFTSCDAGDEGQMLSYRTCVWMLIIAFLFAVGWLNAAGVPVAVGVVLLCVAFVVFIGLTRVVAEGGIGYGRTTMTPMGFTVHVFGTGPIGPAGLTHFAFAHGWAGDIRTAVMTSTANALKLASSTRTRPRYLFWVILIAALVALAGSAWTVISIAYTYGGINLHGWFYGTMNRRAFEQLAIKQLNPIPDWNILGPRGLFSALGASIMGVLMYFRHRFITWPLHYIGFPIGGTYVMFFAWSSMFFGWLFKLFILKYGGSSLYISLRPFFLGLVLGNIVCAGVWMIINVLTDVRGGIGL